MVGYAECHDIHPINGWFIIAKSLCRGDETALLLAIAGADSGFSQRYCLGDMYFPIFAGNILFVPSNSSVSSDQD